MDKTGTLTQGVLDVTAFKNYNGDESTNMSIMMALESGTSHPIAKAMVYYGEDHGYKGKAVELESFGDVPGKGLQGAYQGVSVQLGHSRWMSELGYDLSKVQDDIQHFEEQGASVSVLAVDGVISALWAVEDELRPETIEVVKELQSQGIDVWMLTGDNRRTAQYIAKQAGITHVIAEVLPQDKASKVKELQDKGLVVGMVGDGINDAPALVTADIGFAIGSGTDIAVEAADIVLVRNDLHTLVQAVRLSRKTMTNIKQNLFWALIFNCIGIPLAAIGALNPIIAGTGSNATSEAVTMTKLLANSGVAGCLSVVPYYNKPSQEGLYQHFKAIAQASPLPIVMYNVPGRVGVNMTAETTVRIASEFDNVVAIKEASGNLEQVDEIIKNKPKHFEVISGDDALTFPMIASGAVGVISVIGNALPKEFSRMIRLEFNGEYEPARKIHHQFTELYKLLFVDGNPAGCKALLNDMGMIDNVLRLPLVPTRIETKQKMNEILKGMRI